MKSLKIIATLCAQMRQDTSPTFRLRTFQQQLHGRFMETTATQFLAETLQMCWKALSETRDY